MTRMPASAAKVPGSAASIRRSAAAASPARAATVQAPSNSCAGIPVMVTVRTAAPSGARLGSRTETGSINKAGRCGTAPRRKAARAAPSPGNSKGALQPLGRLSASSRRAVPPPMRKCAPPAVMTGGSTAQGNSAKVLRLMSRVEITASAWMPLPSARSTPTARLPRRPLSTAISLASSPRRNGALAAAPIKASPIAPRPPRRGAAPASASKLMALPARSGSVARPSSAQACKSGHSLSARVARSCPGHAGPGKAGMIARCIRASGVWRCGVRASEKIRASAPSRRRQMSCGGSSTWRGTIKSSAAVTAGGIAGTRSAKTEAAKPG